MQQSPPEQTSKKEKITKAGINTENTLVSYITLLVSSFSYKI